MDEKADNYWAAWGASWFIYSFLFFCYKNMECFTNMHVTFLKGAAVTLEVQVLKTRFLYLGQQCRTAKGDGQLVSGNPVP